MKIQLFDDDDLKKFEDAIAKALVRALRTVMKEGTIAGYTPPKPEAFADITTEPLPKPALVARPEPEPEPEPEPTPKQLFGMRIGDPQSGHGYRQTHPIAAALNGAKQDDGGKKRRNVADFCPSMSTRPQGFVTTDDAYKLMELPLEQAKSSLTTWIFNGAVKGVIVCGGGWTPTKGLPGRLMVDKQMVIARDAARKANAAEMRKSGAGRYMREAAE